MKVLYRQTASDDVVRRFGTTSLTRIFRRSRFVFKDANRDTIESLRQHPLVGAHYHLSSPQLQNLRSWPVAGFEAIRIYYLLDGDTHPRYSRLARKARSKTHSRTRKNRLTLQAAIRWAGQLFSVSRDAASRVSYFEISATVFFAAGFFFSRSSTAATISGNPTVASTKTSPNFPPSAGGTNLPHETASL